MICSRRMNTKRNVASRPDLARTPNDRVRFSGARYDLEFSARPQPILNSGAHLRCCSALAERVYVDLLQLRKQIRFLSVVGPEHPKDPKAAAKNTSHPPRRNHLGQLFP